MSKAVVTEKKSAGSSYVYTRVNSLIMGSFTLPPANPQFAALASLPLYKIFQRLECQVHHIDAVDCRLKNTYRLTLANSRQLYFQIFPASSIPLLRKERLGFENEILTLQLLSSLQLPVPRIVDYDEGSSILGVPFLLTTGLYGRPLSTYIYQLTDLGYKSIEPQLMSLESHITSLRSPMFGSIVLVTRGQGHRRWRDAFNEMALSLLRDAEDAFLNIPYAAVREALEVAGPALDTVTEARLVAPGLSLNKHIYVEEVGGTVHFSGARGFKDAIWSDIDFLLSKSISLSCISGAKTLL